MALPVPAERRCWLSLVSLGRQESLSVINWNEEQGNEPGSVLNTFSFQLCRRQLEGAESCHLIQCKPRLS